MTGEPWRMSLVEAADAIRRKEISSLELTETCLARIECLQPTLNCFLTVDREGVLEAAKAADAAVGRGDDIGPLHGVPLAHKDIFHRKGQITTCGSKRVQQPVANKTATVLSRLSGAGALYLGSLNLSQLCYNPYGFNNDYGHCRNPWNSEHISGGSSSGSCAAVSARLVFGALGSDTGGSIRLPASMCGVVGLLPTYARVSRFGFVPQAISLDNVGALARTVRDCARLLKVIAGPDPNDPTCSSEPAPDYESTLDDGIAGCKIGIPSEVIYDNVTSEVENIMENSLDIYRDLGCELVDVTLPNPSELNILADIVELSEVAAFHAKGLRDNAEAYHEIFRNRIFLGMCIPASKYVEALRMRARMLDRYIAEVFEKVDVLHIPVMPAPVPTISQIEETLSKRPDLNLELVGRNTQMFNYLGLPALAVPGGFASNGLPIGFQLVGRPFSEPILLNIGHSFQAATDYHSLVPEP